MLQFRLAISFLLFSLGGLGGSCAAFTPIQNMVDAGVVRAQSFESASKGADLPTTGHQITFRLAAWTSHGSTADGLVAAWLGPVIPRLFGRVSGGADHLPAIHFVKDARAGSGVRWSIEGTSSQQFGPLNLGISLQRRRQLSLEGRTGPAMHPVAMLTLSRELRF